MSGPVVQDAPDPMPDAFGTLDLTTQSTARAALPAVEKPYTPDRDREALRGTIAVILLCLVIAIVVVLLFGVLVGGIQDDRLEKLVSLLLTPVLALFGTVLGFYFGERAGRQG